MLSSHFRRACHRFSCAATEVNESLKLNVVSHTRPFHVDVAWTLQHDGRRLGFLLNAISSFWRMEDGEKWGSKNILFLESHGFAPKPCFQVSMERRIAVANRPGDVFSE